jgi:hypothetical protein
VEAPSNWCMLREVIRVDFLAVAQWLGHNGAAHISFSFINGTFGLRLHGNFDNTNTDNQNILLFTI